MLFPQRSDTRRRAPRRPQFDVLEDRLVPATFTVTTPLDVVNANDGQLSLREAITAANANPGADAIVLPAGIFKIASETADDTNVAGDFDVHDSTLFQGAGAGTTIIDGQQIARVFDVLGTAPGSITVTFQGLTVRNGRALNGGGAGIRVGNANLVVQDCFVTGNRTARNGGGISNDALPGTGNVTLVRSTIARNVASVGGGLSVQADGVGQGSVLIVNNSTIQRNLAESGAGLFAGVATLTDSTVNGNIASRDGGGLFAENTVTLTDSTVSGNSAGQDGGGISAGTARLINSAVSGNFASRDGGGIVAVTVNLTDSALRGNTAGRNGGGINATGTATLVRSTVSGNFATIGGDGGGIFARTATLTNSTVSGNSAIDDGGIFAGVATLTNSTVSGNSADRDGGGIQASFLTLLNVTVTDNSAHTGGGVFVAAGGTANVRNSIIAGNLVDLTGTGPDLSGAFTSGGHNLIGDGTGATVFTDVTRGDQVGTAADPIDPRLGPLADNGGPTLTHALLPDSPALDHGDATGLPATDQRGGTFRRSFGSAPDIGAFEAQPSAPPATPPADPPAVVVRVQRVQRRKRVDVLVNGVLRRRFFPFGTFTGRVQVQQRDVNGDGLLDVVARAVIHGQIRTRTFLT